MNNTSPTNQMADGDAASEKLLLQATLRINTLIFSLILGVLAGTSLLGLSLVAAGVERHGGLTVFLIGIFLPGYATGWGGGLVGFLWGLSIGALLGAMIYRINARNALQKIDHMLIEESTVDDLPTVVLRLEGPSLGLAIGAAGALGLVTTTNLLVIRGTAAESGHARLLAEILPGYDVSFGGSIVGALELFAVLYVACCAFAYIYNRLSNLRHRR